MLRKLKRILYPFTLTRYGLCTSRAMSALNEMAVVIDHNNNHGETINSENLLKSFVRNCEAEFFLYLHGLTTQTYSLSFAIDAEYDPIKADDVTTSSAVAAVRHQLGLDISKATVQQRSRAEEEYWSMGADFASCYPGPERLGSLNEFLGKIVQKVQKSK